MTISYKGFMRERIQRHAVTIGPEKYEAIVKGLEKAGYPVLSVGKWPSL
jgi:hypothetical protein